MSFPPVRIPRILTQSPVAYDLAFDRNIKTFMVQTGDPTGTPSLSRIHPRNAEKDARMTGTGKGGQSVYGQPFEDEIRPTLKVRLPSKNLRTSQG